MKCELCNNVAVDGHKPYCAQCGRAVSHGMELTLKLILCAMMPLLLSVLLMFIAGCGPAKYGKCNSCGQLYGVRGGNLPGQGTSCGRCNGQVYYPPHKSGEYYEYKREYGGTED